MAEMKDEYYGKGREDYRKQDERRLPTRYEKYMSESRRGDGQGDME